MGAAMKSLAIRDIQAVEVEGHGFSTYVRVYTNEGLTGTGECIHGGPGAPYIIQRMKELLIGENPMDVDRLFEKVRRAYLFDGAIAGNIVAALSGIEIALWDLVGKALELPLYRLLGGKFRDRVRLYADCGDRQLEHCLQNCRDAVALGFNAVKIDIDNPESPHKLDAWDRSVTARERQAMVDTVAAVREELGPDIDLAVDMHARYNLTAAISIANALEPFGLLWLEEPIPPENVAAMRELKRSTGIPICAGENLFLRHGFRDLIEQQAVDIIMPDLPKCCGLSEGRKIANLAEVYYVSMAPHNVCGPLGTMASCHVCASVPNFLVLEWHWLRRDWWDELVLSDIPVISEGYILLSDAPGIGVEVNPDALKRHLRPGTKYFASAGAPYAQ